MKNELERMMKLGENLKEDIDWFHEKLKDAIDEMLSYISDLEDELMDRENEIEELRKKLGEKK